MSYAHPGLREWYANGPIGIEQGFDVAHPPAGRGPVVFAMRVGGDLTARQTGSGVVFSRGGVALRYAGLVAVDASGRRLPASLALSGHRLRISVVDRGARYPLRIDPIVAQAQLTASNSIFGNVGDAVAISGSTVAVGAVRAGSTGAVYVFSKPAAGWASATQTAELTASSSAGLLADDAALGGSVAIDGDTIVAGAITPDDDGFDGDFPGAAFVFVMPAGGWVNATQTAELTASDGAADDGLGASVAISDQTIVAGAPYHEVGGSFEAGAVYVFNEPGGGWANATQTAELTAAGTAGLGSSVAIDGGTIVAGAPDQKLGANAEQGAVYLFEQGAGWANSDQPTAELTASNGATYDQLGSSVAISGGTVVAGAPQDANPELPSTEGAGYADVFVEPGGGWASGTQTAELTAPDAANTDGFGTAVAVAGATIIVGAPGHSHSVGEAYEFDQPAGGWASTDTATELTNPSGNEDDRLGQAVAVSGQTVLAGAPQYYLTSSSLSSATAETPTGSGYAEVFGPGSGGGGGSRLTPPAPAANELTASDGTSGDDFGGSVAVSGQTIVVGAPDSQIGRDPNQGAVYVFSEPAGGWMQATETAKLTASDGATDDGLGTSVAIDGGTVVAGAPDHAVVTDFAQGAAYVFVEPVGGWSDATQTAELSVTDGTVSSLGASVAISGQTIVVGAPTEGFGSGDIIPPGKAFVYTEPGGGWANATQTAELSPSDSADDDWFGYVVGISGSTIAVAAPYVSPAGAVYVYTEPGGGWANATQTAKLTATDGTGSDTVGQSMSISGNTIVAGNELYKSASSPSSGAVWVWVQPGGGWTDATQTAELTSSPAVTTQFLGSSVEIDGDTIVAGADGYRVCGDDYQGAVYEFTKPAAGWASSTAQSALWLADNGTTGSLLGASVAVSGSTVVGGAPADIVGDSNWGGAYVFSGASTALPPSVSGVEPDTGPVSGGTQVTISGCQFQGATAVHFGQSAATAFSVTSPTQITATAPAGSAGPVAVTVTTPGGTSTTSNADQFTYTGSTTTTGGGSPPANTAPPVVSGTARAGGKLTCSHGTWTNSPTIYSYQWAADGTPIGGATSSAYTVQSIDEQLTLTCIVTASNAKGAGKPVSSNRVPIAVPKVKGCPAATGALSGKGIGLVRLGMTRAQARHAYRKSSTRGRAYVDFFCLTPRGIRDGYGSPKVPKAYRKRVIWISTSSAYYAVDGIRVRETVAVAGRQLKLAGPFKVGKNDWYLGPNGASHAIFKVRRGVIQEIGIADKALTRNAKADNIFLRSFS